MTTESGTLPPGRTLREAAEASRAEAARLLEEGDREAAYRLLEAAIARLLAERNSHVKFHRSLGGILGGVTGVILALIIPGGQPSGLLWSFLTTGLVGERIGRFSGEKMSEEEYLELLIDLHHLMLGAAPPGEPPPLDRWKATIVLETPFEIFAPIFDDARRGVFRSLTAVKNLLGFDPFQLALSNLSPDLRSWTTCLDLARLLAYQPELVPEGPGIARAVYSHARQDKAVCHLMGRVYHAYRKKGIDALAFSHRASYGEDLLELFQRDFEQHPDSLEAVANLSDLLRHRRRFDARAGPVYAAHLRLDPGSLQAAAACVRAVEDLTSHQDAVTLVLEHHQEAGLPRDLHDKALLARVHWLADHSPDSDEALLMAARAFRLPYDRKTGLVLARGWLSGRARSHPEVMDVLSREEAVTRLADIANALADELSPGERTRLARHFADRALTGGDRVDASAVVRGARLFLDLGEPVSARDLLEKAEATISQGAERIDIVRLLARSHRDLGQYARAYDLYRGLCLLTPDEGLFQEVMELARSLQEQGERPSLAREALLLLKGLCPGLRSGRDGLPLENLLQEVASVFDYYLPESLEKIGGGGMAEVFRGTHRTSGEVHVIKRLRTDLGTVEDMHRFEELFGNEVRAIQGINRSDHPGAAHVVVLYHESFDESHYCYSMESLDCILAQRLAKGGALGSAEARRILRETLLGLAAAHAAGVVHRDLNPRNIGFRNGTVKIFDFGTAHIVRTTLHVTHTPRTTDYILGTPCYMSPEQASGERFDERTDLFSFGCVAFEVLTGEMAFPGQIGALVLRHDPRASERIRSVLSNSAPTRLVDMVMACLARDADDRPRNVEELLSEL